MRLFILTHNDSKFSEIAEVLLEYGIEAIQLRKKKFEIQADEVSEIAFRAAEHECRELNTPIAVDDTALYIEALRGFPGPYAEYVFRTIGISGILKLMEGKNNRKARFVTAVAYCNGRSVRVFEGILEGTISDEARGEFGFGFDPIFIPEGSLKTLAEMTIAEKNMISHRAVAFRKLAEWLNNNKE
ncbi:MAG: XTP/dITP diphosphatase [Fervidicoccaceae archaeon]